MLILAVAAGCGTNSGDDTPYVAQPEGGLPDAVVQDQTPQDTSQPPADAPSDVLQLPETEPEKNYLVYAHNDTKLFTVDPKDAALKLTEIGAFNCIGGGADPSMTDIAVDKDGKLYGVSATAVYLDIKVNGTNVDCASGKVTIDPGTVGEDAKFYGLTFAPPTAALGAEESLIGANSGGDLYKIDKATGKLTLVGDFGKVPSTDGQNHDYDTAHVGKDWELSGDIVFLENKGTPLGFATLRDCPNPPYSSGCSRVDTLVEINVEKLAPTTSGTPPMVTKAVRGKVLPAGCNDELCGFGSMYGIAAWQDKVYGFARGGTILTINNSTGEGQLVSTALPTPPSSNGFAGAGVTTVAPVIAPPK